jgi:hypothetical protein
MEGSAVDVEALTLKADGRATTATMVASSTTDAEPTG